MEKEHLEILLEDIRGKFDLVLEGHEVLRGEIREVREESNARHDQTAFLLNALNGKIDNVDGKLGGRIDEVEARLGSRIDNVEARLGSRIDKVEEKLGARIDAVEGTLSAKIDALAADLAAHRKDTEAHGGVWRVKENGDEN